MEGELCRFLESYYGISQRHSNIRPSDFSRLAYSGLIRMNGRPATPQEIEHNQIAEENVLSYIMEENKYNITLQGQTDAPSFYHIAGVRRQHPDNRDLRRVYINCNNGNIATLAGHLLAYNTNPNFYLKFCGNRTNARNPRGEKIVIYCHERELEYVNQLIRFTYQRHPDLFREAENTLPFLPKLNELSSRAAQPIRGEFIDLNGQPIPCARSTNTVLSLMLKESYRAAFLEIARADHNLGNAVFAKGNDAFYTELMSLRQIPYVMAHHRRYLLESMTSKLEVLSKANGVELSELHNTRQIQTGRARIDPDLPTR